MSTSRKVILTIIGSSILLALTTLLTYAYFVSNISIGNTDNVNTTLGGLPNYTFIADDTSDILLDVTPSAMMSGNAGSIAANNTATMNISFTSNDSAQMYCTYDIVWEWTTTDVLANRYVKTTNAENEYTVTGSTASLSFNETQVMDYDISELPTNEQVLYTSVIASASATPTVQSWSYDIKFYNLALNQNAHAGATYLSKIKAANVNCGLGTEADGYNSLITP